VNAPRTGRVFRRYTTPLYLIVSAILVLAHIPANNVFLFFDDLALSQLARIEKEVRPPPSPSKHTAVLAIDDASLRDHDEDWPWSRRTIARLLDLAREGGARAVCVDLFFANPGHSDPEGDTILARSILENGHVVLASGAEPQLDGTFHLRPPHARFVESAAAVASPVLLLDGTGQVSRVAMFARGQPDNLFSLSLETLNAETAGEARAPLSFYQDTYQLDLFRAVSGRGSTKISLQLGDQESLRVNFRYLDVIPSISALALLRGEVPASALKDRFVFLGITASSQPDRYTTPLRDGVGGVEIHATVLEGILRGDWIHQFSPVERFFQIVLLGALLASFGAVLRPRPLGILAGVALGGWWTVTIFAFLDRHLVVPLTAPTSLVVLLTVAGLLRYRFRTLVEVTAEDVHEFSVVHDLGGGTSATRGTRGTRATQAATQVQGGEAGTGAATLVTEDAGDSTRASQEPAATGAGTAGDATRGGATRTRDSAREKELPHERVGRLLDRGDVAAAADALRDVEVDDTPVGILYELGRRFEDRAELESAQEMYRAVFVREPEFREVQARLERVSERLRHFDEDDVARMIVRSVLHPRYKQPTLVGKGGMGFVFRVEDVERDGEVLALKVLSPFLANERIINERFRREAEKLAGVEHPNLIRIVDVYPTNIPYYTMEFLQAPSLHELLRDEGPLDEERTLAIVTSAARGLAKAHELGIVHRDLKPDNLVIEAGDNAKVIDFGIAHFEDADALTQAGQILGTLRYMSPEQLAGRPVDTRSDVYSFGLVVHHMLRGALPFVLGKNGLPEAPPNLEPLSKSHPRWAKLLESWLAQEPQERPADGAALAAELEALPSA
jgi:CHASE2 domain-containing sensor protein